MTQINISKGSINNVIERGDNCSGRWYLAVDGKAKVVWAESNRSWNPWGDDAQVFAIPALDPDGSGNEAADMLKNVCEERPEELAAMGYTDGDAMDFIREFSDENDVAFAEICTKFFTEEWACNRAEGIAFLADEFINALNGNQSDECPGFYEGHQDSNGDMVETPRLYDFAWGE